MTIKLTMMALAAVMTVQALPVAAQDRDHRDDRAYADDRGDRGDRYRHTYRGRYQDCRRSKGTTGTIAGAVGGGLIGNAVGGGTLGTIAGAGGGALLGRTLDRNHDRAQNRRNGC